MCFRNLCIDYIQAFHIVFFRLQIWHSFQILSHFFVYISYRHVLFAFCLQYQHTQKENVYFYYGAVRLSMFCHCFVNIFCCCWNIELNRVQFYKVQKKVILFVVIYQIATLLNRGHRSLVTQVSMAELLQIPEKKNFNCN